MPRAELANLQPWIGDLRIEEIRDEQLLRYVRTARVLVLDRPSTTEVLGELFEPQIIAMSPQAFTLSGYERIGDQCYAQSWLVREIGDAWSAVGAGRGMPRPAHARARVDIQSGRKRRELGPLPSWRGTH